uniref:cytochrome c biogenesis protein transmembrane region n=1 Tax=Timspurckia oligopyrenoides TaxID=708627 RepID=UPI001FCE2B95|nr:cytochrome c biogenesis protein transmembrane region [Timspurckia oligopyrenoides]UNJ17460.1 cytochrome c biogenesis protein transmembrane region [Timspurckia oligopyrenoides]
MINDYNMNLFLAKYTIDTLNFHYMTDISAISIAFMLLAGIICGFNPCILSIVPIYVGYLKNETGRDTDYYSAAIFSTGAVSSIASLSIFTAILGKSNQLFLECLSGISGFIIIIMGLISLGVLRINLNRFNTNPVGLKEQRLKLGPYINGVMCGLLLNSCSTSTLVTLILWIINTKKITTGIIFIAIYTVGYILPALFFSLTISQVSQRIKSGISSRVNILNGSVLVALGTVYVLARYN